MKVINYKRLSLVPLVLMYSVFYGTFAMGADFSRERDSNPYEFLYEVKGSHILGTLVPLRLCGEVPDPGICIVYFDHQKNMPVLMIANKKTLSKRQFKSHLEEDFQLAALHSYLTKWTYGESDYKSVLAVATSLKSDKCSSPCIYEIKTPEDHIAYGVPLNLDSSTRNNEVAFIACGISPFEGFMDNEVCMAFYDETKKEVNYQVVFIEDLNKSKKIELASNEALHRFYAYLKSSPYNLSASRDTYQEWQAKRDQNKTNMSGTRASSSSTSSSSGSGSGIGGVDTNRIPSSGTVGRRAKEAKPKGPIDQRKVGPLNLSRKTIKPRNLDCQFQESGRARTPTLPRVDEIDEIESILEKSGD